MKKITKLVISLFSCAAIFSFSNLSAEDRNSKNNYSNRNDYNYQQNSSGYSDSQSASPHRHYNYSSPYGSQGSRGGYRNYKDQSWKETRKSNQ